MPRPPDALMGQHSGLKAEACSWLTCAGLPLDLLLFHWGDPHVTDGGPCFCLPDEVLGVVMHRRLPWDPPATEGEA